MEVIPAIDLRGARVVRLYQGDYQRQTTYSNDPVGVAREWERQGAPRLHVVDLDGARAGSPVNLEVIHAIIDGVKAPVQVGGGLRHLDAVRQVLDMGAARVVLGTAAVEDPALLQQALQHRGPEAVVVSVDARGGQVAVHGWTQATSTTAVDLVKGMQEVGVRRFLYTDIARDGTLTEPNFAALAALLRETQATLLASGGIASLEHLRRLAGLGVEGAILGSALYTGAIDLTEAVAAGAHPA